MEKLQLTFASALREELQLRFEIEGEGNEIFRWDGGTTIFRPESIRVSAAEISDKDLNGIEEKVTAHDNDVSATYIVPFKDALYKRSSFISLDSSTISSLANAMVNIKCFHIKEPAVVTQEIPSKKVASSVPVAAATLEDIIIEMSIPLFSIIKIKGNAISGTFFLENDSLGKYPEIGMHVQTATCGLGALLQGNESHISLKIAADNDLSVRQS